MVLRTAITTALISVLLAPAAFAQTSAVQRRPGVARPDATRPLSLTARQRMQQRRIQLGQRRGTITATERATLLARQRQIQAMRQRLMRSNNGLDMRERMRLHRKLNELSRSIRRFGRGK